MTLTVSMHEEFAAMVPPVRLTVDDNAVAVGVPLQVFVRLGEDETTRPEGSESLTATPVRPTLFGFVILRVKVVLPFKGMVETANVFKSTGGAMTVRLADELFPVPPSVDVTGPAVFM